MYDLLLYEREGAAALPPGTPAYVGGRRCRRREEEPVVVLGEGLARGAVEGIEVLSEAESRVLLGLDQLVFVD